MLRSLRGMSEQVTVIPRAVVVGDDGEQSWKESEPIELWVRIQESTSADVSSPVLADERSVERGVRLYCQYFPADENAHVVRDDGRKYRVVGAPKRFRQSRGTARNVVKLDQLGGGDNGVHSGEH